MLTINRKMFIQFQKAIFTIVMFFFLADCTSNEENEITVKNCRIKEMFYEMGGGNKYSYTYNYNNDGTLRSINSTNYSVNIEYENGKPNKLITNSAGQQEVFTITYPSANVVKWVSSVLVNGKATEYNLTYKNNLADSLKVKSPDNSSLTGFTDYISKVTYSGNNVSQTSQIGGCCTYKSKDVVVDNGLNPLQLLYKSTNLNPGNEIMNMTFFGYTPESLSINNVTQYTKEYTQNSQNIISFYQFLYVYSKPGSYPIQVSKLIDGKQSGSTQNYVYENCD